MSIGFVFGAAGSGKSTYVQDYLIEQSQKSPKENFLLIVPDQFTMQTQMDIVKRHPNGGILNIDVLSFGRLSYRVFSVAGKPEVPVLDDTGKSLILRKVAASVADKMPFLGRNLNKVGFIHEIKSSISEFMQYGLSVKDIENISGKVHGNLLKSKLDDLAVIYEAFNNYISEKYITNEETLDLLCKKLEKADFIKDATIVFDGFTGFTPIQERVVLRLCELAKKVLITFNLSAPELPSEVGAEEKLFYLSRKGANRLKSFAADLKIPVDEDIIVKSPINRFTNAPEFSHMEENLFRQRTKAYQDAPSQIMIHRCKTPDDEVSNICLQINNLVRSGEYAYKDIAVVTGNLDTYGKLFESRMRELDMPVFIDKTSNIVLNPFIEYIKSSLQVISNDYSFDSVMRFLRSGFTEFSEEEADRFERYIRSLGIRGKNTYSKPFKKYEKGLSDKETAMSELLVHEDIRQRLYGAFAPLNEPSETAGDYVRKLYDFVKANNSYEKLSEYEKWFEEANDLSKAKEYGQIYKCIMDLFDAIVLLIGDEKMDIKEFIKVLEAGIAEIEVGTIPRNVDRIVVGDIERTRMSEVKALFFAGVNDGNVPKTGEKGGILSGVERQLLLDAGYDLAPSGRDEMFTQRLYLYMTLCKPTGKLFISFCDTDTEGKGIRPSYLIDVIKEMFPKLEVKVCASTPEISGMISLSDSKRFFASLVREYAEGNLDEAGKELTAALLRAYSDKEYTLGEEICDAGFFEYIAKPLSQEIIKLIYGSTLYASISRMEMYAGCAYRHFLKYGMKLKDTKEYTLEKADLGTIYHGVLDLFATELARNNLTFGNFSEEQGHELIEKVVKEYCAEYEQGIFEEDEKNAYMIEKILKIMTRTVDTLRLQMSLGKFRQESHEYSFEREVNLSENRRMVLNGKVDRIDLFEENGKIFVKIIDYKSGDRHVDITNIYHGIEQQLSLYMAEAVYRTKVANPGKEVIPAGLFYYTINDPMFIEEGSVTDERLDDKISSELRLKGIVEGSQENLLSFDEKVYEGSKVLRLQFKKDGEPYDNSKGKLFTKDEMEGILKYVENLAVSVGERIYSGDKSINPMQVSDTNNACQYCTYNMICRFDEKIPGYKARDGKEIDAETAKARVLGGGQDGIYLFD